MLVYGGRLRTYEWSEVAERRMGDELSPEDRPVRNVCQILSVQSIRTNCLKSTRKLNFGKKYGVL